MPYILSLESSSEVCSVCVSEGGECLSLIETKEPFSHTRKMTLFIDECLKEAGIQVKELSAVAVSDGPGSYTGLRVSAATAKGLCFGLGIPLIAVDTLQAIADHARYIYDGSLYIPMIDARRMEVYYSVLDPHLKVLEQTNNLILETDVFSQYEDETLVLCGTGVEKSKEVFKTKAYDFFPFDLSAKHLIRIAQQKFDDEAFENIVSYGPNYFKAPKVTQSKKPLF